MRISISKNLYRYVILRQCATEPVQRRSKDHVFKSEKVTTDNNAKPTVTLSTYPQQLLRPDADLNA